MERSRIYSRMENHIVASWEGGVSGFSDDSSVVFSNTGQAYRTRNGQRLRPGEGRKFHSLLRQRAKMGRLFIGNEAWDTLTEFPVGSGPRFDGYSSRNELGIENDPKEIPEGLVWKSDNTLKFLPREPFSNDPRTIELWAEVLTRKRMIADHDPEILTETEWEKLRQQLLLRVTTTSSPLLTTIAKDRAHWRRVEARALERDRDYELIVVALDRLIEIEPTWYYQHSRGLAKVELGNWASAARDFLDAGREAGSWYWKSPPPILDKETVDLLLLDGDAEHSLRNGNSFGSEVAEVALHYLALLRKDGVYLREIADAAMSRPDPSPAVVEGALKITARLTQNGGGSFLDRATYGLTLYRAGLLLNADAILNSALLIDPENSPGRSDRAHNIRKIRLLLSMTNARLARIIEAKQWLKLGKDLLDEDSEDMLKLSKEAEELILALEFPADPFSR